MVWPASSVYYDGIIGGKTGYTDQARTTLVTYAQRNGITFIVVVLHSDKAHVYNETKSLLDYGFNNFKLANVSKNDIRFTESNTLSLQSPFCNSNNSIYLDKDSNVVIPKNTDFSKLTSSVQFNLSKDSFATITYKLGETSVGTAQIKYQSNSTTTEKNENETEKITTVSSDNAEKNNNSSNETKKSSEKEVTKKTNISKTIIKFLIILVIAFILIILLIRRKQKLDRIRQMKRHRNH